MLTDRLEDEPELQGFARRIEESASTLLNTGPWSNQPPQVLKLDLLLERYLKELAGQRNIVVDFKLNAPEIYICVNPVQFQHVLRHLVRNAARAMSRSKERKLTIITRPVNGNAVEILFRDSGPGISKELQLSIFQRRVSTKSRGGFGLLLVRQMIDGMEGQIRLVPQNKGRGATFSIRFPVSSKMDGSVE
jgi:two-component system sensor histidine kinase HydH